MAEITYLLGAGASYGALPVVEEMYNRIGDAIKWFKEEYRHANSTFAPPAGKTYKPEKDKKLEKIVSDLEWLKEICNTSKNFSVDTYARKLDLSGKTDEYLKLKNVLAFYFTLEQRRIPPDVRYDNFWASLLKSKTEFPNNIKIISWNYDFQLELTYQDFLGTDSLKMSRKTQNIAGLQALSFRADEANGFKVFKLNGSATFSSNQVGQTNYWIDNFNGLTNDKFVISLVETYEKICNNDVDINNHLSFAWDYESDMPFYKYLKTSIENTEILVVIGYSFPFFNREKDKRILNEFMKKDTLKKVYFQAPEKDLEDIRERFLAINNNIPIENLVLRKDIKQFTLPNEL